MPLRFILFTGLLNNKHAKWHQDCHIRFNQCSILLLFLLTYLTNCLTSKASGLRNSGWQKEPNCHASLMSISTHCAGELRSLTNESQIWLLKFLLEHLKLRCSWQRSRERGENEEKFNLTYREQTWYQYRDNRLFRDLQQIPGGCGASWQKSNHEVSMGLRMMDSRTKPRAGHADVEP